MMLLSRTNLSFNQGNLSEIELEWEFDEDFSRDIIESFDLDKDGIFNSEEVIEVYNHAFISLKNYNYFTYLRIGDERFSPDSIYDFNVKLDKNNNILYLFKIPINNIDRNDFYLSVYDFTYFCACFYQEENPVFFIGAEEINPRYEIVENKNEPIYFDPYAGPDQNTVYTEYKEGLTELYIKEIHIKY